MPEFPDRFSSILEGRDFCQAFFGWYNGEHRRDRVPDSGGFPLRTRQIIRDQRQEVLAQAHEAHPERFRQGAPEAPKVPTAVWINKPSSSENGAH